MASIRPQTVAEIAQRERNDVRAFDMSVREFLDSWQTMTPSERTSALAEEPVCLSAVKDAYLAALAEHLALSAGTTAPKWADNSNRFLSEPFFAGGLESLKAILLVESPLSFRRRLIFISADALSRPRRGFIEDNAIYATLDV